MNGRVGGWVCLLENEVVSMGPDAPLENPKDGILYGICIVVCLCEWVGPDWVSKELVCIWDWFVEELFSPLPCGVCCWALNESVVYGFPDGFCVSWLESLAELAVGWLFAGGVATGDSFMIDL